MGWLALAVLGAGTFGLLRLLGVGRGLGAAVGAAIALGAIGFALQARPGLVGAPVVATAQAIDVDPGLAELRLQMFGRHTQAESLFFASDALLRAGSPASAVTLLLGGANANPRDAAVWTALGSAYALHDGNVVSPAARLAFDRALKLAPRHPGPPFFLGAALVQAGEFQEARRWWMQAFILAPDMSFRAEISERLAALDAFLAMAGGRGGR